MHSRIRIGMLMFFCLSLSACGRKSSTPLASPQKTAPEIQVNIVNGKTLQLSASDLSVSGVVTWVSDDEKIVTIDANGLASAKAVGVARITATSFSGTGSALIGVVSPDPGQPFTLSGRAQYEDKPFDKNGFTGVVVPTLIRNAVIQVVAIDGFKVLASGVTDEQGNYLLPSPIDPSSTRGGAYLKIVAQTQAGPTGSGRFEIRNNRTDQALLSVISSAFDNSTETTVIRDVLAPEASIGGAFNLLDVFSKANAFLCPSAASSPAPCPLPLLTGYWEPGGTEGTFFLTSGQTHSVFICGGGGGQGGNCIAGDSDVYDDAIIAHEYGHFALNQFSRDDSPGGIHGITENDQDIRLSWSEGWANFFSSAVRSDPFYVDTNSGTTTFFFDIEVPTSPFRPGAIYTTSELAVAGMLWDILDGPAPSDPVTVDEDPLDLTFDQILQLLRSTPFLSRKATMESFWLAFEVFQSKQEIDDLQFILKDRQIELFPDEHEPESSPPPLLQPGIPLQHHTFYRSVSDPSADLDTIQFNAVMGTTYIIETLNLTSGADTFLTVLENNRVVQTNDNRSGITHFFCGVLPDGSSNCPLNGKGAGFFEPLSSSVRYTATRSGPITVEVKRAPLAPPSAGEFGSYDLLLTVAP
ncbi:MAG: Ig-like domain-containing protein [Nitrospiria bacterium]